MSITTYCMKINNLWIEYSTRLVFFYMLAALGQQQERRFCCFCFWDSDVIPFFTPSETLSTIALGCRWGSRGAIFNPSSPVIGPDGCKAALLQNMSRAGEEEVGVDSGKRATSKNIALHVLLLPQAVTSQSCCWNVKTGCQAATNRKSKSSLKCICLFLKRGWLLARGHAAEALDVI